MRLVLDSNIWNKLEADEPARQRIAAMGASGSLVLVAPWTLAREMASSPWGGFPDWFPIQRAPDTTFLFGYSPWGEESRMGGGNIFQEHRGTSSKFADALIADAAEVHADGLVTEDRRARARYAAVTSSGRVFAYESFRKQVLGLATRGRLS